MGLNVGNAGLFQDDNIHIRELRLNGKLHRIRIAGGVCADGDNRFVKIHRLIGYNIIFRAEPRFRLRFARRLDAAAHAKQHVKRQYDA